MQVPILRCHFDLCLIHSLSFQTILGGQGGDGGLMAWLVSSSGPKLKITKKKVFTIIATFNLF
jgi:hypothetical protein